LASCLMLMVFCSSIIDSMSMVLSMSLVSYWLLLMLRNLLSMLRFGFFQ
jgi:hypothetical protein